MHSKIFWRNSAKSLAYVYIEHSKKFYAAAIGAKSGLDEALNSLQGSHHTTIVLIDILRWKYSIGHALSLKSLFEDELIGNVK